MQINNEKRITLKLKIRRRQRLGMSIQMLSKNFVTLLAHILIGMATTRTGKCTE